MESSKKGHRMKAAPLKHRETSTTHTKQPSSHLMLEDLESRPLTTFTDSRHLKVAVSSKGICTAQLTETKRSREQFEIALNTVITGKLAPLTSRQAVLSNKLKLKSYRSLVTKSTKFNIPVEENQITRTIHETKQIFMTSRIPRLSLKPVVIIDLVPANQEPVQFSKNMSPPDQDVSLTSIKSEPPNRSSIVLRRAPTRDSPSIGFIRGRFDPFRQSPWTFYERKCFFMSNFKPPHQRNDLPNIIPERVTEKESTLLKAFSIESNIYN